MIIIAFGHRQRVGKDTAAKMLISALRQERIDAKPLSFAAPMKGFANEMYGWAGMQDAIYYENNASAKDIILPRIGKTPRQVMLELGYSMNQIHPKTLPELALKNCDAQVLVNADVRRVIETEYIRLFNGMIFKVDRDVPKLESKLTGHPAYQLDSELHDYAAWDGIITNDGSLRDLNKVICEKLLPMIKKRIQNA